MCKSPTRFMFGGCVDWFVSKSSPDYFLLSLPLYTHSQVWLSFADQYGWYSRLGRVCDRVGRRAPLWLPHYCHTGCHAPLHCQCANFQEIGQNDWSTWVEQQNHHDNQGWEHQESLMMHTHTMGYSIISVLGLGFSGWTLYTGLMVLRRTALPGEGSSNWGFEIKKQYTFVLGSINNSSYKLKVKLAFH